MHQFEKMEIEYEVFDENGVQYHRGVFELSDPVQRRAVSERFTDAHRAGHTVQTRKHVVKKAELKQRLGHRFKVLGGIALFALALAAIGQPPVCNAAPETSRACVD